MNKPITNPELMVAIKVMKKCNTQESQDNVINEVMKAHFISPVTIFPAPEPSSGSSAVVLKEKTEIKFTI